MNISKELKKVEAIKRMQILGLYKPYINLFKMSDEIFLSEMTGGVYEFHSDKELVSKVKEFETKYNALVYHVIHTYTEFGELYNFLYVSDYEDEWELDNTDITDGHVVAYVWNKTDEWLSELGGIGVKGKLGGIVRVY